jgi:general secretion pathway protein C
MKRRTLIILFAVTTVLSGAAAFGLTRVLSVKIRPPEGAELVEMESGDEPEAVAERGTGPTAERGNARGNARAPRAPTLDSYRRPIVGRSLFDSSQADQPLAEAQTAEGEEQAATDLGATLILTAVAGDRQYSTALILAAAEDAYPGVYTEGDALTDDATIDEIQRRRVYVKRGSGAREYLEIGGEAPKKSRTSRSDDDGTKKRRGRIDWSEGVTKIDDTHFQIERSAVDSALANLDRLSRDARVVPNFQDGKSNGFKIFSIKRNSAARNLGLQNNDVITGVNGSPLTSPDKALSMYSSLQNESSISLEIIRKGEPVTMEYDIL